MPEQTSEQSKDPVEILREAFARVSGRLTPEMEPATIYIAQTLDDNS
ncbi:MAG TPA: hypothetical protein VH351_15985 [Bryobacteraceae bacterium]|nr:hypothetical protein [Bryobacteraceae bacterium]